MKIAERTAALRRQRPQVRILSGAPENLGFSHFGNRRPRSFAQERTVNHDDHSYKARTDPADRFWAKVDRSGDCWIWTAGTGAGGYGVFKVNRRTITAHRYSLLMARGNPPADKPIIRHACDNVLCVNPAHMCWGTHQENEDDKRRSVAERIDAFARNTQAQESAQWV